MGGHFPPPWDCPDQGSNPDLLHWQVDSLSLSHQRSPSQPINPHTKLPSCLGGEVVASVDRGCPEPWTVGWVEEGLNLIEGGDETSKG